MKIKLANLKRPELKGRILVHGDSPTSFTGFATVNRHIFSSLYKAGNLDIDIVGINFNGDFYDKKKFPYTILPASIGTADPYGNALLVKSLQQKHYDILFVINDSFAVNAVSQYLKQIQDQYIAQGVEPFKIIYYFPVDCHILENWTGMMKVADRLIAYNEYGMKEAEKVGILPHGYIYHGTDSTTYHQISKEKRTRTRHEIFQISDDNTFLWINVNRNSLRKDMTRTLWAFHEFRKQVPNSKLYLHTAVIDGKNAGGVEIDLQIPCKEMGLKIGSDVMFPEHYSAAQGIPDELLNHLYCSADGFITTTLGEGYGLTVCEAMAAGVPTVSPNSTSFPEIIGGDGVRGYLYDPDDRILIDSSGMRPFTSITKIVEKMILCHSDRFSMKQKKIVARARAWTEETDWKHINKQWVDLFVETLQIKKLKLAQSKNAEPEAL